MAQIKLNKHEVYAYIADSSTMTAMVNSGLLERRFSEINHCYTYRPILPINEEYKYE